MTRKIKCIAADNTMNFPSPAQIKKVTEKLRELGEYSYLLPDNADLVDRKKYEICRKLLIFKRKNELTQRQVAKIIGIPETRISEILHYKIWKFSLDRLVQYCLKINPKLTLKVT